MSEKPARDTQFTYVFALLVTLIGCAFVLLAAPRPIVPTALPPLVLDAAAVKACLAADRTDAQTRPSDDGIVAMYRGFLAEGLVERGGPTDLEEARAAQGRFATLTDLVTERIGKAQVQKLRAHAVEQFELALKDALPDKEEQKGLIGSFDRQLVRYGFLSDDGVYIAPRLSIRAMYKVRWNMIHSLPRTEGLKPVEIQAFEGFLALHSAATEPARRAEAARAFRDAGGHRGDLALAIWLYHGGQEERAKQLMDKLAEGDELFVRNYRLALAGSQGAGAETP